MDRLHVGRGTSRGALTVFPIWGEHDAPRGYTLDSTGVLLSEVADGPSVNTLLAVNGGERPVLLLEGQLLEGGWQNRMLTRSVLVPSRASADLEVACVEAGRWHGSVQHSTDGRRASMRVRNVDRSAPNGAAQQEVWRRIAEYDNHFGDNPTSSLVGHADRAAQAVDELVGSLKPLPGQVGVLVGIAGQPVMFEVFDSPRTLWDQFASIVRAAGLDALGQQRVSTPARRAVRFVDRAALVHLFPTTPAGAGTTVAGRSAYASVTGLEWRRHLVHLGVANPRHPLNLARVA